MEPTLEKIPPLSGRSTTAVTIPDGSRSPDKKLDDLPLLKSIEKLRNYKILALLAGVLAGGITIELLAQTLLAEYLKVHTHLHSFLTLLSHAFVTASVIGIVYDLLTRRELVESFLVKLDDLKGAFTQTVSSEANSIKDSLPLVVINPEHVSRLISEGTAKEILPVLIERVCKSSEVKDAVLQAISSHFDSQGITWRSLRHALEIQPLIREDWLWRNPDDFMELHDRMSYRTVLRQTIYTFVCCRNLDDYKRYEFDNAYDSVWFMPRAFFDGTTEGRSDLFEIVDFRIDGQQIEGKQSKESADVIMCKFELDPSLVNADRLINYTVNTILRRNSHFYKVRATVLTKGMILRADIDGSLTTSINVLDFFPNDVQAWTNRRNNRLWTEVETEDWIFPGQGVAIVWD
jgi:hypothetical protein